MQTTGTFTHPTWRKMLEDNPVVGQPETNSWHFPLKIKPLVFQIRSRRGWQKKRNLAHHRTEPRFVVSICQNRTPPKKDPHHPCKNVGRIELLGDFTLKQKKSFTRSYSARGCLSSNEHVSRAALWLSHNLQLAARWLHCCCAPAPQHNSAEEQRLATALPKDSDFIFFFLRKQKFADILIH